MSTKRLKTSWIIKYIAQHGRQNLYTSDFVRVYVDKFRIKKIMYDDYGFMKVPELNNYMRELCKLNVLDKKIVHPKPNGNQTLPTWFFSYGIKDDNFKSKEFDEWLNNPANVSGVERLKWTFELLSDSLKDNLETQSFIQNKDCILQYINEISKVYEEIEEKQRQEEWLRQYMNNPIFL